MAKANPHGSGPKARAAKRTEMNRREFKRNIEKKRTRKANTKGSGSAHKGEWWGSGKVVPENRTGSVLVFLYVVTLWVYFSGMKLNRWSEGTMKAALQLWKSQQTDSWKRKHPKTQPVAMKVVAKLRLGNDSPWKPNRFGSYFSLFGLIFVHFLLKRFPLGFNFIFKFWTKKDNTLVFWGSFHCHIG